VAMPAAQARLRLRPEQDEVCVRAAVGHGPSLTRARERRNSDPCARASGVAAPGRGDPGSGFGLARVAAPLESRGEPSTSARPASLRPRTARGRTVRAK
jgi:hypothetical protein